MTALDALLEAGVNAPYSSMEGICATCETAVISQRGLHEVLAIYLCNWPIGVEDCKPSNCTRLVVARHGRRLREFVWANDFSDGPECGIPLRDNDKVADIDLFLEHIDITRLGID